MLWKKEKFSGKRKRQSKNAGIFQMGNQWESFSYTTVNKQPWHLEQKKDFSNHRGKKSTKTRQKPHTNQRREGEKIQTEHDWRLRQKSADKHSVNILTWIWLGKSVFIQQISVNRKKENIKNCYSVTTSWSCWHFVITEVCSANIHIAFILQTIHPIDIYYTRKLATLVCSKPSNCRFTLNIQNFTPPSPFSEILTPCK